MLIPYLLRFPSRSIETGEYEKSENGEFPPTEGSPYIVLTPRSCDLYRMTNYNIKYFMKHLMYPFMVRFDVLQKMCGTKRTVV